MNDTVERSDERLLAHAGTHAGVAVLFSGGAPTFGVTAVPAEGLIVGREPEVGLTVEDRHMSRRHTRIQRQDNRWRVVDLGSRNGTFVNGRRVTDEVLEEGRHLVRIGASLVVLLPEASELAGRHVHSREGQIIGPTLAAQLAMLERFAASNRVLHVRGETGSGKELAARRFHAGGPTPQGPFVAVNCGAIPRELAEGLLFGAKKGAFTGAVADTDGYLMSASGGTVFLDEVGELPPPIQAKLLRVLETQEVVQLGASRGRKVDVRICSATHKDLRSETAEGRFREDLYFRLGRPLVVIPPLRQRIEEVAFLVRLGVDRVDPKLRVDVSLVEACLLRPWPGNVRELLTESREAARRAADQGDEKVDARHLDSHAGLALAAGVGTGRADEPAPQRAPKTSMGMLNLESVTEALRRERGNLSRTARALGVHRTQLKRFIAKHNVEVLKGSEDEPDETRDRD